MQNTNTAKSIARWIVFLPAAIVGSMLCSGLAALIFHIGLSRYAPPGDRWGEYVMYIGSHLVLGASFVFIGAYIAPDKKKIVAVSLTGLLLVLSGAMLLMIITTQMWNIAYKYIAVNVGSIAMTVSVFNGDIPALNSDSDHS